MACGVITEVNKEVLFCNASACHAMSPREGAGDVHSIGSLASCELRASGLEEVAQGG